MELRKRVLESIAANDAKIVHQCISRLPKAYIFDLVLDTAESFLSEQHPQTKIALRYLRASGNDLITAFAHRNKISIQKARENLIPRETVRSFEALMANYSLIVLLNSIFQANLSKNRMLYVRIINELLSGDCQTEALAIIETFGYPHGMTMEMIAKQFILSNDSACLIKLNQYDDKTRPYVLDFLESMAEREIRYYHNTVRHFTKLTRNLFKKWNVSIENYPYTLLIHRACTINYVGRDIVKRCKEKGSSDLISKCQLQVDNLVYLCSDLDISISLRLLKSTYGRLSRLPGSHQLINYINSELESPNREIEPNRPVEVNSNVYQHNSTIHIIRTTRQMKRLSAFLRDIDESLTLALDAEWVPFSLDLEPVQNANLLQIGCLLEPYHFSSHSIKTTNGRVCWLVDLDSLYPSNVDLLFYTLLNNRDIHLLGFEFTNDVKMLKGISEFAVDLPSKLTNISPKNLSLAKLVQERMGLVLDKSACQSQWSRRPLRRAQIDYAAADVMVLIDLVDSLTKSGCV